ncbi:MAG TPA: hypothetical protein EYQ00_06945 [Dehalococcoidia bacterium]|nr:hypothetical protein [Dehalococcoidia bacterium]
MTVEITLFSPDITCDSCIETIKATTDATEGARFLAGDADRRSFSLSLEQGVILDELQIRLSEAGYSVGSPAAGSSGAKYDPKPVVVSTDHGAKISYTCPCGSSTETVDFDRSLKRQAVHSCCDHHALAEVTAAWRLLDELGSSYQIESAEVEMPWGQSIEFAIARLITRPL